jgi:hypothetical protein
MRMQLIGIYLIEQITTPDHYAARDFFVMKRI